jgi:hypothetical protein
MSSESGRFLRFNPATSVRRQSDVAEPRKRRAKTILDEGWPLQRSGHVLISLMESMCYKMEAAISSGLPPFGWPKGLSQPARRATKTEPDPSTHGAPRSRFHERPHPGPRPVSNIRQNTRRARLESGVDWQDERLRNALEKETGRRAVSEMGVRYPLDHRFPARRCEGVCLQTELQARWCRGS